MYYFFRHQSRRKWSSPEKIAGNIRRKYSEKITMKNEEEKIKQ